MKKPWLAALLSFLIVGLGLGYLGKWGWATTNFSTGLVPLWARRARALRSKRRKR
jgi:hypothetical protein